MDYTLSMYKGKNGCTLRQMAYAKRILGGQGTSKKTVALDVGYSPNVSNSVASHIENTAGFNNAMSALALESNNLALSALHEFKIRGFKDFTNKDLIGALNAIGSAWSRFNPDRKEKRKSESGNKLRTVILQQVENQTIDTSVPTTTSVVEAPPPPSEVVAVADVSDPLDF